MRNERILNVVHLFVMSLENAISQIRIEKSTQTESLMAFSRFHFSNKIKSFLCFLVYRGKKECCQCHHQFLIENHPIYMQISPPDVIKWFWNNLSRVITAIALVSKCDSISLVNCLLLNTHKQTQTFSGFGADSFVVARNF